MKFIYWILLPYLYLNNIKSYAYFCCWMYIYIRLQYSESNKVFIYSFKLSVSTMFLSLLITCCTFYVFFLSSSLLPFGAMADVYAIVASAYFSNCFLSSNLLSVIWDLYYLEFIDNFSLKVKISKEARMIPEMAAIKLINLPR